LTVLGESPYRLEGRQGIEQGHADRRLGDAVRPGQRAAQLELLDGRGDECVGLDDGQDLESDASGPG
jgi:hypothetical protein